MHRTFRDRREAGRVLAGLMSAYRGRADLVVLGLARGGVPVAYEIASALHARLDVFIVRKLGVPQWPELAMGAIASGGGVVVNDRVVDNLHVTDAQLRAVMDAESRELIRREAAYRAGRPAVELQGETVILTDDGIATGASMLAAVPAVRAAKPAAIVVAVPVAPRAVWRQLRAEVDDVVCATMPRRFEAVGQVFGDFHQVDDDEVRRLLDADS